MELWTVKENKAEKMIMLKSPLVDLSTHPFDISWIVAK